MGIHLGYIHESSASRIVKIRSSCIASQRYNHRLFPIENKAIRETIYGYWINSIVGVIDLHTFLFFCLVQLFKNRKWYFSIIVQATCDSDLKFSNVARWPGSTHGNGIFDNSTVCVVSVESSFVFQTYHLCNIGFPKSLFKFTTSDS